MKRIIVVLSFTILAGCKNNENNGAVIVQDSLLPQAKTEYTCPMHPEIVTDTPSTCPRCGMELEIRS